MFAVNRFFAKVQLFLQNNYCVAFFFHSHHLGLIVINQERTNTITVTRAMSDRKPTDFLPLYSGRQAIV